MLKSRSITPRPPHPTLSNLRLILKDLKGEYDIARGRTELVEKDGKPNCFVVYGIKVTNGRRMGSQLSPLFCSVSTLDIKDKWVEAIKEVIVSNSTSVSYDDDTRKFSMDNPMISPTHNAKDSFEREDKVKFSPKLKYGYYRLSTERKVVKYIYVPGSYLRQPGFTFDDVFAALGINVPNLIFSVNDSPDVISWNLRLPTYKTGLVGCKHPNPPEEMDGALRHYQGVVRENCRRLIKGTSTACEQGK